LTRLIVAKFGGSAIGADGLSIPIIIQRINSLKKDSKIIAVFSAPLTIQNGMARSLTDIVLELGKNAEKGKAPKLDDLKNAYEKILELVLIIKKNAKT
jgi:aspartate kinase